MTDQATDELRELIRLRDRIVQEIGDRVRQLHRLVDLGFPEFIRYVRTLGSQLATALLRQYPTAQAFVRVGPTRVSKLSYEGRHRVGLELARQLVDAARQSVGAHPGPAYRVQVKYLCEDLDTLRVRLRELDADLERHLDEHAVGSLLTSIDGIGKLTAARLVAELGDPAEFASASALAAYVGVIPSLRQSGKGRTRSSLTSIGHRRLRAALWMPTLTAIQRNPWLRRYYQRLRTNGKPAKVALLAAMRKLLIAVYAVARNRQPFVPHVPHEV
jgi:transposase